jgi:hypothetical protein
MWSSGKQMWRLLTGVVAVTDPDFARSPLDAAQTHPFCRRSGGCAQLDFPFPWSSILTVNKVC